MIKAIPTEYRGTRYRSKSEAVFARCLDLAGYESWYEFENDGPGHPWDFTIYQWNDCRCCGPQSLLIEYKPSRPTDTYVQNLIEKVDPQDIRSDSTSSFIVYGSPWQKERPSEEVEATRFDINTRGSEELILTIQSKSCYGMIPILPRFPGKRFHVNLPDDKSIHYYFRAYCPVQLLGLTYELVQEALEYRFDLPHTHSP